MAAEHRRAVPSDPDGINGRTPQKAAGTPSLAELLRRPQRVHVELQP
jgi:hypothetical protein